MLQVSLSFVGDLSASQIFWRSPPKVEANALPEYLISCCGENMELLFCFGCTVDYDDPSFSADRH